MNQRNGHLRATVGVPVIGVSDTTEPLLSSRVPNLQSHNFLVNSDTFTLKNTR